ncbi:GNAT family N-acetyltransferase [uncultured Deefgea sp.]|uniref:GNAT family N-acetyltransferase n=1 Tax=uncultured Deefgea sp. TaxID=1304914 RepID=UPI002625D380|nr:GNAT family N-acetyltransferase [uncultured Deefgea sp.]
MSYRDFVENPLPAVFSHTVPGIGDFQLQPLRRNDFELIHQWVTAPRAQFWGMQNATQQDVAECYGQQIESPHCWPYLAYFAGKPAFLLESYNPAHDVLGQYYSVAQGDIGMHFLVAPAQGPAIHGFTHAVMNTILTFLFSHPATQRVVVEPDVNNQKIHPLNRDAGFQYLQTIALPSKTAWFAVCERHRFLPRPAQETTV